MLEVMIRPESAERIDDPAECMNESSESQIDDDPTRTDTDQPVVLPGVHLPRNAKEWDEANTFFSIKFSDALYLPIESLDEFTRNFQRSVYDYFAENYGTVKNDDAASDENLDGMSVKDLKKRLSWLKKHPEKGEEIHRVSKLIRSKLKGRTSETSANKIQSENINTIYL